MQSSRDIRRKHAQTEAYEASKSKKCVKVLMGKNFRAAVESWPRINSINRVEALTSAILLTDYVSIAGDCYKDLSDFASILSFRLSENELCGLGEDTLQILEQLQTGRSSATDSELYRMKKSIQKAVDSAFFQALVSSGKITVLSHNQWKNSDIFKVCSRTFPGHKVYISENFKDYKAYARRRPFKYKL